MKKKPPEIISTKQKRRACPVFFCALSAIIAVYGSYKVRYRGRRAGADRISARVQQRAHTNSAKAAGAGVRRRDAVAGFCIWARWRLSRRCISKNFCVWFRPPFGRLGLLALASLPAAAVGLALGSSADALFGGGFLWAGFLLTAVLLFLPKGP